VIVENVLVN